jgi:hypothetical protein
MGRFEEFYPRQSRKRTAAANDNDAYKLQSNRCRVPLRPCEPVIFADSLLPVWAISHFNFLWNGFCRSFGRFTGKVGLRSCPFMVSGSASPGLGAGIV